MAAASSSTTAAVVATVGILSIGEMGLGIAKLLRASGYRVVTNVGDRSPATQKRAEAASLDLVRSDADLARQSDYILSIVPPRDALATARRIATATKANAGGNTAPRSAPLYYLDLNAVSPQSAREIAALFPATSSSSSSPGVVRFIDGGIIGGAPAPPAAKPGAETTSVTAADWKRPSLVVSGPFSLDGDRDTPRSGSHLFSTLNMQHVGPEVGTASGLKMCFASLTKGFTAIATQSFSTAQRLGVLDQLQAHLASFAPGLGQQAEKGLVGMPPKAFRWVREMHEIGDTFREDGNWRCGPVGRATDGEDKSIFDGVEEVFRIIADETTLGQEKTEQRVRGKDVRDFAACLSEDLEKRGDHSGR